MDTQNQNHVDPDYNFILNQGETPSSVPGHSHPKNSKRKLLIIFGGIVIFLLLIVAVIVVAVGGKVQRSASSDEVVDTYLSSVAAEDYDVAYELLSPLTRINQAAYTEQQAVLADKLDMASCKQTSNAEPEEKRERIIVTCQKKDQQGSFAMAFTMVNPDDTTKIAEILPYVEN